MEKFHNCVVWSPHQYFCNCQATALVYFEQIVGQHAHKQRSQYIRWKQSNSIVSFRLLTDLVVAKQPVVYGRRLFPVVTVDRAMGGRWSVFVWSVPVWQLVTWYELMWVVVRTLAFSIRAFTQINCLTNVGGLCSLTFADRTTFARLLWIVLLFIYLFFSRAE
jgi:hypothetical protein